MVIGTTSRRRTWDASEIKMYTWIKQYPTPISGLALGIASLAVCWSLFFPVHASFILIIGFVMATLLLIPLKIKFICYPRLLWLDLQHPGVGSTLPTLAMTLMVLSDTINRWQTDVAIAIWLMAVIAHLLFFMFFVFHRLKAFNIQHIMPSWFVPPVGILVACLTMPSPAFEPLVDGLFIFGIVAYFILLPIFLFRLFLYPNLDNISKPSLAILAAPASLSLAAYLTYVPRPEALLIAILFGIAVVMTATVYLMLIPLLRLPFSPAFAAYTFPLGFSATASFKMSMWAAQQDLFVRYAPELEMFAGIEACVATLVVFYVMQAYGRYLCKH